MKKFAKSLFLGIFVITAMGITALPVSANSPMLSANYLGSGSGNVQVTVTGADAYSQVTLYSRQSSTLWTVVNNFGQTDGSGYFTQVISMANDGSGSAMQMYVTVNGQQSSTISVYPNGGGYYGGGYTGCSYYGCSVGGLTLSQTSLNLTVGQSAVVTASYPVYGYNNVYISNNSNTSVATASVSNNQITIYGLSSGSTTVSVCASGSVCASLYVTVGGSVLGANTNLWFTPANPNMYVGQSLAVSINSSAYTSTYGYVSSAYYISSNSNSSVVSATISGTVLNLYANQSGSSNITICHSSLGFCSTLYVTVGGSNNGYGSLSLSQTSLSLTNGQSSTVNIYGSNGYYGNYYISSNSNSYVASATINGSSLYVNALSAGSTTLSICQSYGSSSCVNLFVSVTGYNNSNSSVWFSQSSLNLNVGQSGLVTTYSSNYGGSYYVSSNTNPAVASVSVSGSTLTVYGLASGTTTVAVCQTNYSACGNLSVTVGNTYYGGNMSLSQTSMSLGFGQTGAATVYGSGSSYYYISSNSNAAVASANISGNTINVYANYMVGTTTLVVCQSNISSCANLYVTVSGSGYGYNNGYNGGTLSLGQTSLTMTPAQHANINIYGNGSYYISSNTNSAVVSASISGSVLSVYANQNGNSTVTVCQSGYSSCNNVYITVSGYSYYGTGGGLQYPGSSGSSVLGAATYPNGQLISEGSTVYIVYRNTKTGFSSGSVFTGLGFKFSNVMQVGNSGLADSGYTVRTAYAQHPWGSWIKSGNTIYFVHESGLIPVGDYATFLNNGGQDNLVVNANVYDFRLPILSTMVTGDGRLQ